MTIIYMFSTLGVLLVAALAGIAMLSARLP